MHIATKFYVFIGNYGSGKTEISLNFALSGPKNGAKTALVDLDIVNPYFRSSEKNEMLETAGVVLIAPPYAKTGIDLPVVSAAVDSVFVGGYDRVVFDVGGDSVGATALGRYYPQFEHVRDSLSAYYVVNTRRPLASTSEDIALMLDQIVRCSRMPITGFINNANLARDTEAENLIEGDKILKEVAKRTGVPIAYVTGWAHVLDEFARLTPDHSGELLPISTYMRPDWLDSTR